MSRARSFSWLGVALALGPAKADLRFLDDQCLVFLLISLLLGVLDGFGGVIWCQGGNFVLLMVFFLYGAVITVVLWWFLVVFDGESLQ